MIEEFSACVRVYALRVCVCVCVCVLVGSSRLELKAGHPPLGRDRTPSLPLPCIWVGH